MRHVEDEIAAPRQRRQPRPHQLARHHAGAALGPQDAAIQKARLAVVVFRERDEQQRVAGGTHVQRKQAWGGDEGGVQGLGVAAAHAGRHWALKAIEIRGVSAVLGWTKW